MAKSENYCGDCPVCGGSLFRVTEMILLDSDTDDLIPQFEEVERYDCPACSRRENDGD